MRAFIMLLCAVVVGLAALILLDRPEAPESGLVFDATHLIADARTGETAVYRDERGETWTFKVEQAVPGGADRLPQIRIWSVRKDRKKLKKKLEEMEWDTSPYYYYNFYISNFEVGDRPRYFHGETCEPVDPGVVQKQLIEDLRAQ